MADFLFGLLLLELARFAFRICFTYDPNLHPFMEGKVPFLVYKIQPFNFNVNSSFVLSFTEAVLGFHVKGMSPFHF